MRLSAHLVKRMYELPMETSSYKTNALISLTSGTNSSEAE